MAILTLYELLGDIVPPACHSREVLGLCADSRTFSPGDIFFAISGGHLDSHHLIPDLVYRQPAALIVERDLAPGLLEICESQGIPVIRVEHSRTALSKAAACWFGYPSSRMQITGVTGTDGKSSTVYFIWQLLRLLGFKAGFFSTVSISYGDDPQDNPLRQSSPEPLELHRILQQMESNGVSHVVMESTSHGLSPRTARLNDIEFKCGVFTNLSHEHLEFHGTYDQYRHDKANLMRRSTVCTVVNRADAAASYFLSHSKAPCLLYQSFTPGQDEGLAQADCWASDIEAGPDTVDFVLHSKTHPPIPCHLELPGVFNVDNVMAAILAIHGQGLASIDQICPLLPGLKGVKGRMVPIRQGQDFSVIVDYAHTPGSFQRLLPLFRQSCRGRLIGVFGSAGERDIAKRPMLGALAARYCDLIILCNEDPRLEDPQTIIDQIAEGALKEVPTVEILRIEDRRSAIGQAFSLAGKSDMVLLLGKGHEQSMVMSSGKLPWDEEGVAREILETMGFNPKSTGTQAGKGE